MKQIAKVLLFVVIMMVSVLAVSAEHTPTAELTPLWSPAGTNVDYTVDICNDPGSDDALWRIELVKNDQYDDFECEDIPGYSKAVITYYDTELQATTQACQYNSLNPVDNLQPGQCQEFEFSATTPDQEDCNLLWKFRTYDEETQGQPNGAWERVTTTTGVDSTAPVIEKELSSLSSEGQPVTSGNCLPSPNSDEICWVTDDAQITFNAYDPGDLTCEGTDVVPSGLEYCTVQVLLDGQVADHYSQTIYDNDDNDLDSEDNSIEYSLSFLEDTQHDLVIECFDVAGNSYSDTEKFKVDMTAPQTDIDLEAGNEYFSSGESQWLDTDSAIEISAVDMDPNEEFICAIGLNTTFYREFYFPNEEDWDPCQSVAACNAFDGGDADFTLYEGQTLSPGEESCHVIEAYSVDDFGNTENLQRECYFVDKTAPTMEKLVGEPKAPFYGTGFDDEFVSMFTQAELDNNWVADRAFPTGGVASVDAFGRTDVAQLTLDETQTAPGIFQRTEGIKKSGNFGTAVQADLYVDSDWQNKAVRAGLWVVGDDGAGSWDNWFGIVEFVNNEDCPEDDCENQANINDHEGFRIWDSNTGWTTLNTSFNYDEWYTLTIVLDPVAEQYLYYINNEMVGTAQAGENFISDIFLNSYNYGLDSFPTLSSDGYQVHWDNAGMSHDWFVTTETDIELTCVDEGDHPSGEENIMWKIYMTDDYLDNENAEWELMSEGSEETQSKTINFEEASLHRLEWTCVDAVNKGGEWDVEIFGVDEEAPVVTKEVTGVYSDDVTCPPAPGEMPESMNDSDACFLRGADATVSVSVADFEANHASHGVECAYSISWYTDQVSCEEADYVWDGQLDVCVVEDNDFAATDSFDVQFNQDSMHELDIVCRDAVGNEVTDTEYFLVDITAPETSYDLGPENSTYVDDQTGAQWVDSVTEVTLGATDNKIGVENTFYRISEEQDAAVCATATACSEFEGTLTGNFMTYSDAFGFPEEGCRVIEYYSVDALGNEEDVQYDCMFVDKTAPVADVEAGNGPSIPCEDLNDETCDASWVTTSTDIDLFCDFGVEESNPAPLNNLYYQVKVDNGTWGEVMSQPVSEANSMNFAEDSYHMIRVWCDDAVGKTSEIVEQTFRVDTTAPTMTLTLQDPYYGACDVEEVFGPNGQVDIDVVQEECFVDTATRISLDVQDGGEICAVGEYEDVVCEWRYDVSNGTDTTVSSDWMIYNATEMINFPEESYHTLYVQCTDALGNVVEGQQAYSVDKTAPEISIALNNTVYENGTGTFVAVGDGADVTVTDVGAHLSGVATTEWRLTTVEGNNDPCNNVDVCNAFEGDGAYTTLADPLSGTVEYTQESCHILEVVTTDNVGKTSKQNTCVFVDNTAPVTAKQIGEPHSPMSEGNQELGTAFYPELGEETFCDEEDKCVEVTLLTPVNLACNDIGPHPSGAVDVCFQVDFDGDDVTQDYCADGTMNDEGYCCTEGPVSQFYFTEESWHKLSYYCTDNVGNEGVENLDVEYFKVEGTAFEIELNKKWNLISVPVKLIDNSMDQVFSAHEDSVEAVWTYDNGTWFVYSPDGVNNDNLNTMLPGWGYWVLATEDDLLTIGGSLFSPATTPVGKEIVPGWNLLGYYGAEDAPIGVNGVPGYYGPDGNGLMMTDEFDSLTSSLFDEDSPSVWSYWEPDNPQHWKTFGSLDRLDPGAGYWVYAYDNGMFVPPTNTGNQILVANN
jgi:hypothetical protein